MTVDIICPLYNAEKDIERLHQSLLIQKDIDINEVKYILTESNDKTEEILNKLNLKYKKIKKEEFSHSLTREQAAFECKADIIVFVTQDVIIEDKKWLYYLIKDIQEGNCAAAFSRQLCSNNTIEKYTREKNYPKESYINSNEDVEKKGLNTFFFSDAASAIKREIFDKLNGYDSKILPTNEDMYIAYKLIMNGYKIKYCAESKVVHSHKLTLKQLYDRYYNIGLFFKENSYLNKYKVSKSGGDLAKYILKRAWQDKNWKVLIRFLPDMAVRFIGMKIGKLAR